MKKNSELVCYLEGLSADELAVEIIRLAKLFSVVRDYYKVWLSDNGDVALLEKCQHTIQKAFSSHSDFSGPHLRIARQAVMDFIKVSDNCQSVAEAMLCYTETGVKFTNTYGDMDTPFYESIERMYDKAAQYVISHGLRDTFQHRFQKMVMETSDIGWGFHDELMNMYTHCFRTSSS